VVFSAVVAMKRPRARIVPGPPKRPAPTIINR
jgi:hypothetical protein